MKSGGSKHEMAIAVKVVSALALFGILIAALSGFYILGNAESLFWGGVGLVLLSLFYLIGKSITGDIHSKGNLPYPLYKRVFHFLLVLCLTGFILALEIFAFRYLGE